MGLSEFLELVPDGNTKPVPYAALAELSGLSAPEARSLAATVESWGPEMARDMLSRLAGLTEDEPGVEFEAVFKACIGSEDSEVRRISVIALAESSDRTLAASFASLVLNDPELSVRVATAVAMSDLCTAAAAGRLHPNDGRLLREALSRVVADVSGDIELRRRALESLSAFRGEDIADLIGKAFGSGNSLLQQSALYAMGKSSEQRWLKSVTAELDAEDAAVRFEAVTALGEIGTEEHARTLKAALDDTDLEVQVAAVVALEKLGGEQARLLLFKASRSPEPRVAATARESLASIVAEDGLNDVITPEMAASGGLFGGGRPRGTAESGGDSDEEEDAYNASDREGWSWLARGPQGDG